MPIKIRHKGNFEKTRHYLVKHSKGAFTEQEINEIAEYGLQLFIKNTPSDSGKTARSWSYTVDHNKKGSVIVYSNSNIQNGLHIAVIVDTGHALADGKWVSGKPYIDKTVKEIYDYMKTRN